MIIIVGVIGYCCYICEEQSGEERVRTVMKWVAMATRSWGRHVFIAPHLQIGESTVHVEQHEMARGERGRKGEGRWPAQHLNQDSINIYYLVLIEFIVFFDLLTTHVLWFTILSEHAHHLVMANVFFILQFNEIYSSGLSLKTELQYFRATATAGQLSAHNWIL